MECSLWCPLLDAVDTEDSVSSANIEAATQRGQKHSSTAIRSTSQQATRKSQQAVKSKEASLGAGGKGDDEADADAAKGRKRKERVKTPFTRVVNRVKGLISRIRCA